MYSEVALINKALFPFLYVKKTSVALSVRQAMMHQRKMCSEVSQQVSKVSYRMQTRKSKHKKEIRIIRLFFIFFVSVNAVDAVFSDRVPAKLSNLREFPILLSKVPRAHHHCIIFLLCISRSKDVRQKRNKEIGESNRKTTNSYPFIS